MHKGYLTRPILRSRKWIAILGVIYLVNGFVAAITVFGLLIAWVPMWLGVILLCISFDLRRYEEESSDSSLLSALKNLESFFRINCILMATILLFGAIAIGLRLLSL